MVQELAVVAALATATPSVVRGEIGREVDVCHLVQNKTEIWIDMREERERERERESIVG